MNTRADTPHTHASHYPHRSRCLYLCSLSPPLYLSHHTLLLLSSVIHSTSHSSIRPIYPLSLSHAQQRIRYYTSSSPSSSTSGLNFPHHPYLHKLTEEIVRESFFIQIEKKSEWISKDVDNGEQPPYRIRELTVGWCPCQTVEEWEKEVVGSSALSVWLGTYFSLLQSGSPCSFRSCTYGVSVSIIWVPLLARRVC